MADKAKEYYRRHEARTIKVPISAEGAATLLCKNKTQLKTLMMIIMIITSEIAAVLSTHGS